jgi:transposase
MEERPRAEYHLCWAGRPQATISVAIAEGERGGEVRHWGTIPNRADHVRRLAEKLGSEGRQLQFCYEAGPCGYGLHRQLTELGHDCMVVAPSLIPVKTGDRVKTDRRDGIMLAKLHRAGELTAVWVPDGGEDTFDRVGGAQVIPDPMIAVRPSWAGGLSRGILLRGLRQTGWRRASRMEERPHAEYHLCRAGCPLGDDHGGDRYWRTGR